jgi:hypothetical protein
MASPPQMAGTSRLFAMGPIRPVVVSARQLSAPRERDHELSESEANKQAQAMFQDEFAAWFSAPAAPIGKVLPP